MTKFRTTSAPFFISLLTNKKPRCCSVLFILRNEENAVCVFYLSLVVTHVCAPVMSASTKLMLYTYLQIGRRLKKNSLFSPQAIICYEHPPLVTNYDMVELNVMPISISITQTYFSTSYLFYSKATCFD